MISKVAASEMEEPKPGCESSGVRTAELIHELSRMVLGKPAREGESPVSEKGMTRRDPEYHETRGTLWNERGPPRKAKYSLVTDSA